MEENQPINTKLEFRNLRADEIECRVGQINEKGLTLLLYKTSRVDVDILNETVGAINWTNEPKIIDGNLWMGIGIWDDKRNNYTWKWSVGTESNMESEKGQDSDAIKRAAFRWGLGVELYSAPFVWIPAEKYAVASRGGKPTTYDHFSVAKITYKKDKDGKELKQIENLAIRNDRTGQIVFSTVPITTEKKEEIIGHLKGKKS